MHEPEETGAYLDATPKPVITPPRKWFYVGTLPNRGHSEENTSSFIKEENTSSSLGGPPNVSTLLRDITNRINHTSIYLVLISLIKISKFHKIKPNEYIAIIYHNNVWGII